MQLTITIETFTYCLEQYLRILKEIEATTDCMKAALLVPHVALIHLDIEQYAFDHDLLQISFS